MVSVELGTDGARGAWGEVITPETGYQLGAAAVIELGLRNWVSVQDTRRFNPELFEAFREGLASQGARAIDLGVLPTPAAALIASKLSLESDQPYGAVSFSASHNDAKDAGIKIFGAGGEKLNEESTKRLQIAANQSWRNRRSTIRALKSKTSDSEREAYREDYLNIALTSIDDDLRNSKFLAGETIVLDMANGAAHWSAPEILGRLGAIVVAINFDPNDEINKDCGATKTDQMHRVTRAAKARIGLALDGDADRLQAISIDSNGEELIIDGDVALAIGVKGLDKIGKLRGRGIVVTAYSNLGLEKLMSEMLVEYVEVANGDRYVAEGMDKYGYPIGGENSGHTLFTTVADKTGLVRSGDGMISALQLLQFEALIGKSMNQISDWEKLPHISKAVELPAGVKANEVLSRPEVSKRLQQIQLDLDNNGRLLVRGSGTEPLIRILVKHHNQTVADDIFNELEAFLQNAVSL